MECTRIELIGSSGTFSVNSEPWCSGYQEANGPWNSENQDGGPGVPDASRLRHGNASDIHKLLQVQSSGARRRRHGKEAAGRVRDALRKDSG